MTTQSILLNVRPKFNYLAIFVVTLFGHAVSAADRPNVILAMADDQGWGDVGYNGHPDLKTPVLDEMAASGLRFDHFYAAAPVCSPTRASVMTGRTPNRSAVFKWGWPLRSQESTVAEALKLAGYTTGHFGKWHLGSVRAKATTSPGANGFDVWLSSPNFYENDVLMSRNGKVVQTKGESSMLAVDAALEFMADAQKNDEPFLAVIWFGNPHGPHQPTPELAQLYEDQPRHLRNYYGEITGIDRAMGKLRSELRKRKLADNTLLWYTSDNGPQGGGRGLGSAGHLRGRKGTVYEGGLRVPTIIEWPAKIAKPRTTDLPTCTYDIYPTLVDLLDIDVPNQPRPVDGISLVPLLEGNMDSRTKPLGFWDFPAPGISTPSPKWMEDLRREQAGEKEATQPRFMHADKINRKYPTDTFPGHAAWRDGPWKLHRITKKNGTDPTYELYNLATDEKESKNVLESEPETAKRLQKELDAWLKSVVGSLNGEDY